MAARISLFVSEVADYEVRRSLLLNDLRQSIRHLNELRTHLIFAPITTDIMLRAAEFWAQARRVGRPTAHPHELDCDVILAAQIGAVIATENIGHLAQFVDARHWRDIRAE